MERHLATANRLYWASIVVWLVGGAAYTALITTGTPTLPSPLNALIFCAMLGTTLGSCITRQAIPILTTLKRIADRQDEVGTAVLAAGAERDRRDALAYQIFITRLDRIQAAAMEATAEGQVYSVRGVASRDLVTNGGAQQESGRGEHRRGPRRRVTKRSTPPPPPPPPPEAEVTDEVRWYMAGLNDRDWTDGDGGTPTTAG